MHILSFLTLASSVVPFQAAHICNNGIHYFVEHSMKCPVDDDAKRELLGCNLFDFAQGMRFSRFSDQQVHWPGGVRRLDHFQYTQHDNVPGHHKCLMHSNCDAKARKTVTYVDENGTPYDEVQTCYGTAHQEFNMPDYCSRAMMSELSTMYNGVDRETSILAGASVLMNSANKRCFWYRNVRGKKASLERIFQQGKVKKACWNHANDWRKLYCVKYHTCECPDDMTEEECHFNPEKVQCCKDRYQEFLESDWNVYKGNPLASHCIAEAAMNMSLPDRAEHKGHCTFNPVTSRQTDFSKGGRHDFSNLY